MEPKDSDSLVSLAGFIVGVLLVWALLIAWLQLRPSPWQLQCETIPTPSAGTPVPAQQCWKAYK